MTQGTFDIFMIGVGGQGIGLLAETLIRAAHRAGFTAVGVDTHGLAQRGGVVTSALRLGPGAHSPLIPDGGAHLVLALERHEALRGTSSMLRPGGTLVYYDAVWQPLAVRLKTEAQATEGQVAEVCQKLGARCLKVFDPTLPDARMQNVALLRVVLQEGLIPGLTIQHLEGALGELLSGPALEANLRLLRG